MNDGELERGCTAVISPLHEVVSTSHLVPPSLMVQHGSEKYSEVFSETRSSRYKTSYYRQIRHLTLIASQGAQSRKRRPSTKKQQEFYQLEPSSKAEPPTCPCDDPLVPTASPITPPQATGSRGSYQCLVDYKHEPFFISWSGAQDYPDLSAFPAIDQGCVTSIQQTPAMAAIWRGSALLDYGSHASVRISDDDRFPVIKLAHPDDLSVELIQHELEALTSLSQLGYHVGDFDKQPIQDAGVICGFRMERLHKLEGSELHSRSDDIMEALSKLHSAGFCHGDLSPSNIMKDHNGTITLIDFSFTGRVGLAVPPYFPRWVYPDGIYDAECDIVALKRYI